MLLTLVKRRLCLSVRVRNFVKGLSPIQCKDSCRKAGSYTAKNSKLFYKFLKTGCNSVVGTTLENVHQIFVSFYTCLRIRLVILSFSSLWL